MIITAIVTMCVGVLSFFMSMVPSMRINFSPDAQASLYSVISNVSAFVPVTQVGIIVGLILLIYAAEFLWLLLNWLIAKVPFIE